MTTFYVVGQEKTKRQKVKEWIREKGGKTLSWIRNNEELSLLLLSAALGAAAGLGKAAVKAAEMKKEKEVKEFYCYDRSLGHYWALKRDLSNAEWVEIDQRKQKGERLGDILNEIKVLR